MYTSFNHSSNFNSSSYCFKFRNVIVISKAFLYLIMNGAQLNSQTLCIFMEASHLSTPHCDRENARRC